MRIPIDRGPSSRAPDKPWIAILAGALLGAGLLLGTLEIYLRNHSYLPSVVDDKNLWSLYRHAVYPRIPGERVVVTLGASRMQLGFSSDEFHERYPGHRLVRLEINGTCPLDTLHDLAEDERFVGTVLVAMNSYCLLPNQANNQRDYVEYFHREWGLHKLPESVMRTWFQSRLAVVNPHTKLLNFAQRLYWSQSPFPPPAYLLTRGDRSRVADYTLTDTDERQREQHLKLLDDLSIKTPYVPPQWLVRAVHSNPWIEAIQARGGRVIFMHFPGSGAIYAFDERIYPKERYWDLYRDNSLALVLHFKDIDGMDRLEQPDEIHLGYREARVFTRLLLAELERHGLLSVQDK